MGNSFLTALFLCWMGSNFYADSCLNGSGKGRRKSGWEWEIEREWKSERAMRRTNDDLRNDRETERLTDLISDKT